jgi:hypothetical protein
MCSSRFEFREFKKLKTAKVSENSVHQKKNKQQFGRLGKENESGRVREIEREITNVVPT